MTTERLQEVTNSIEKSLVTLKSKLSEKKFIDTLQEVVYMSKTLLGTKAPSTSMDYYKLLKISSIKIATAINKSLELDNDIVYVIDELMFVIKELALDKLHKPYLNKLNSLKIAMKINSGIKEEGDYKFFTAKAGKDVETTDKILQDIVSNFHSDYYCYAKKSK